MKRVLLLMVAICAANSCALAASIQEIDARQTVVIANKNVPESVELARYYMERRGIPTNHLCVLDLPVGETMARWYYENKLRDPLQQFLRDQQLIEQIQRDPSRIGKHDSPWRSVRVSVRYLVSMYGVPLRIAESRPYLLSKLSHLLAEPLQRDGAAVDSELSALFLDSYDIQGTVPNTKYNLIAWSRNDRQPKPVMIAGRLDGPSPEIVRGMIDGALVAEKDGLHGRVYIDMRAIRDPDYLIGDFWLREAGDRFQRLGFEVVMERSEELFEATYPMEDAAVYLGWYTEHATGPFRREEFRFRPGAIAYHLHSTSAHSLKTTDAHWAAPLLARGATAVMGAIDEPFLEYTPDLQVFADRIASGYSFGESAYLSQRVLSWQMTVVGDPLYRPFAIGIDDRIKQLTEAGNPDVAWEHMRRINQFVESQQFNMALKYGRDALKSVKELPLREKLAELYAKNDLWEEALKEFRAIIATAPSDVTTVRVGHRLIWMLHIIKQNEMADQIEHEISTRWPQSPFLPFLKEGMP